MKKLFGGTALGLAAVLGVVALTGAGCHRHGGHPRDPAQVAAMVNKHLDDVLDDLDATPDQRTRIHALADKVLAEGKAAHAGQAEAHATVIAQWKADQVDRAKLHALVDARIEAFRKVAHAAVDAGADAHDVLTPAQREKIARKAERWHR